MAVFGFFIAVMVALAVLAIVVWIVAHGKATDEQARPMRDEPAGRERRPGRPGS